MDIKELLTKEDIDLCLNSINKTKLMYSGIGGENMHYNRGLCSIFYETTTWNYPHIYNVIYGLMELDSGISTDYETAKLIPDGYVPQWGIDRNVHPYIWYRKRIEVLLKARDIITNQEGEYYV